MIHLIPVRHKTFKKILAGKRNFIVGEPPAGVRIREGDKVKLYSAKGLFPAGFYVAVVTSVIKIKQAKGVFVIEFTSCLVLFDKGNSDESRR